jgi:hypothetical protein
LPQALGVPVYITRTRIRVVPRIAANGTLTVPDMSPVVRASVVCSSAPKIWSLFQSIHTIPWSPENEFKYSNKNGYEAPWVTVAEAAVKSE